jgi:hypothetical protein
VRLGRDDLAVLEIRLLVQVVSQKVVRRKAFMARLHEDLKAWQAVGEDLVNNDFSVLKTDVHLQSFNAGLAPEFS